MNDILLNDILEKIKNKIDIWWNFQPILFLWENIELLNKNINLLINELFIYYKVDKNYLFKLNNNDEKIKINQIRDFILKSKIKTSFKFQIFLIENISRMNIESFNSCLKFLEEPWDWNIIFLTDSSESWILDTILSRVQIININSRKSILYSDFFLNLIDDYLKHKNTDLLKYFFDDKKITKDDYINFLNTFLFYIKKNFIYMNLVDNIEKSLNLIQKNNVIAKYEIDKILTKI